MRIFITTILSLTLAMSAFAQEDSKKPSPVAEKKPAAEGRIETPFGTAKYRPTAAPKPRPQSTKLRPDLEVVMDGQNFKFSKQTPFGPSNWTRAESELSAEERAIVEQRGLLASTEEAPETPEAAEAPEAPAAPAAPEAAAKPKP